MDILYRGGRATAAEVLGAMPDPPSYSAVRAMLRILEEKGHVRHEEEGVKYVFVPVVSRDKAKQGAVSHLVETFFEGSVEQAVAALLDSGSTRLKRGELDRLQKLIDEARRKGD